MLQPTAPGSHELLVESREGETLGRCTCGAWERACGHDVVLLTGRSREEALRASHALHARGIEA